MAKKKEVKTSRSDILARMMTESQKSFGSDYCYTIKEHRKTHYGVPLPHLSLQYLFNSTVLPLERIMEVSGPFGSGKSSFCYELLRFVMEAFGIASIIETENKTSVALMESILGKHVDAVRFHRTKTMEDAQNRITKELGLFAKVCTDKAFPMAMLLDSIVGSKAEETIAKVKTDGHADRGFSKEALIISTFMGALADSMVDQPVLFMYTNHEKDNIKEGPGYGPSIRNPGGAAPDFHNTYHLRVTKIGSYKTKENPGNLLKIQTKKSSMGDDKRSITVDMRWEFSANEQGDTQQYTWFDWDKATAELLASDAVPRNKLKDIITVTKVSNTKYNCTTLKLKEVPPDEVGKAIRENEELMARIRPVLGIFTWKPLIGTEE